MIVTRLMVRAFFALGTPFHRADCRSGFGVFHCCFAFGLPLLGFLAAKLEEAPTLHCGIEHFQGAAARVDLVVMGEIGKPFEDAEKLLVPGTAQDLHIAGPALRAKRPEPRLFVAALLSRCDGEAAERAYQILRLARPGS